MSISFADSHHPRFLITRLSAVGDCIHTMPVIGALRRHFPGAYIAWATQRLSGTLLQEYPGLDQVIEVDRNWMKSPRQVRTLRRKLRSLKFDVCLDCQSLTKSSMLGWISGAKHRVGFAQPQGRELALILNNTRVAPTRSHVVERYLELTGPLGVPQSSEAHFDLAEWRHEVIDRFLRDAHLTGDFAVINPGAGWDSKLWPARRFAQVARHLGQSHQLPSAVCWAGDQERQWAEQIVAGSGGHALMAPPTTLPELASLMRQATMCVGSDTGPLHLAAAVDTPCIGLYGPTRPGACGPYGEGHINVQVYLQQGSGRERRGSRNDAMLAIEPKLVQSACDTLLQNIRSAHAA